MKKPVNPNLIVLAREATGLTQTELAEKVGINQANISRIENGFVAPSEEILNKISSILTFPKDFFYEDADMYSPQIHFYRKAKALAEKDFSQIKANGIIDRLRIEKLIQPVLIEKDYVHLDIDEYERPEEVAKALRKIWKIPRGTIKNLVLLLESKGIIIFPVNFGTRLISDLTTQTSNDAYIIFLNKVMSPDRDRFTLAHALGHVIMHQFATSEIIEEEADRFAGEFLMPSDEIKHQLVNLNIERLADLKRQWKVSMAAIFV